MLITEEFESLGFGMDYRDTTVIRLVHVVALESNNHYIPS